MELIKKANTDIPYTIIYNEVARSRRLTFESKGLLFFLLSLPPNFVVNKKWIVQNFNIGRRSLTRSFTELKEEGYITVFDMVKKDGRYKGVGYLVYPKSQLSKYNSLDIFSSDQNGIRYKPENTEDHFRYSGNVHLISKEINKSRSKPLKNKLSNQLTRERGPF